MYTLSFLLLKAILHLHHKKSAGLDAFRLSFVKTFERLFNKTFERSFDKTFEKSFEKTFDRSFDKTFDRSFDETFDKTFDRSFDRSFDKTFDRLFDKTFDRSFDKTFDRSIDKSSSSDFLKMGHSKLARHLVQHFSGQKHFEKPIRTNTGLTAPNLPCLPTICLMHSTSYNISRKWAQLLLRSKQGNI